MCGSMLFESQDNLVIRYCLDMDLFSILIVIVTLGLTISGAGGRVSISSFIYLSLLVSCVGVEFAKFTDTGRAI